MQNVPKKKHAVRRHSRILLLIFAVVHARPRAGNARA